MQHYLINNEIKKGFNMPKGDAYIHNPKKYYLHYNAWIKSLQPCDIKEIELTNIIRHLSIYDNENYNKGNPIDITNIIEFEFECGLRKCTDRDGYCISCISPKYNIKFKQPKHIDMKYNKIELLQEDLESIHLYLDDLKIPRKDINNEYYSIVGRIKFLQH